MPLTRYEGVGAASASRLTDLCAVPFAELVRYDSRFFPAPRGPFLIPVCNRAALELVERHGMTKVFETARIYRGAPPALPLDHIFGITSFELG